MVIFPRFLYVYHFGYQLAHRSKTINGLDKGTHLTGMPHDLHGKIDGFRFRFSQTNPLI